LKNKYVQTNLKEEKQIEIKFGEFEEVEKTDEAKASITKAFARVKSDKYTSIYAAYPHQCYSDEYEPAISDAQTLEVYFYSLPSTLTADSMRGNDFELEPGVTTGLYSGQRDLVNFAGGVPTGYTSIEDSRGQRFAIAKDNKIWILYDLYHGLNTEPGVSTIAEVMLNYLVDTHICPPSTAELRTRMIESIDKQIKAQVSQSKKNVAAEAKRLESEASEAQRRFIELTEKLSYQNTLLEMCESVKRPQASDIVSHIEKIPYVEKLKFTGGSLTVYTKEISCGPLKFGKWEIKLVKELPVLDHDMKGSERHPYEYGDGHFCLGGFTDLYINAMLRGELDKALSLCRLEITNYSTTTKQVPIEEYLSKRMGKEFKKHMESVKLQFKTKVDDVTISKITGNEVTYIGVIRKPDGGSVPTTEKLEVTYKSEEY